MNIYLQEVQVASVLPQLDISEKHRILGLYKKGYSITRYAIELLQSGIDNNLQPSLFARAPVRRPPQRTPPAPLRDSLLGFRGRGTASQSQPTPTRRSVDVTCRAASLANSSDLDGWELTDNVQPSSEKRTWKIG